VRRADLERAGIQLPVLPTIVLGGLPGGAGWAARLEGIGLDVVASGAVADDPATWGAARAAVPHRPVKAVARDAAGLGALAAAGCVLAEGATPAEAGGVYVIGPGDTLVTPVDARAERVEDADEVAAAVLAAAGDVPSAVWVAAGPGLAGLAPGVAAAKLAAMVDGTRRARLHLAKNQFDLD
jgi:hypothetical protein